MRTPTTRPATRADALRVGEISYRSHTVSYGDFASTAFLAAQVAAEHAAWWKDCLTAPPPGDRVFVAEVADEIVGFSKVGPLVDAYELAEEARSLGEEDPIGVVYAIHVDPERIGTGAGWALMKASLGALRQAGFAAAVLDTHAANRRSRRFYEAGGWQVARFLDSREGERLALYRIALG